MLLKCVNSECWSSEYYSFHKKALAFKISRNALACTILKILCCRKTSQITNNLSSRISIKSFCGKNFTRSPNSIPMIHQDNAQIVWSIEHRMWTRRYPWGIQRLVSTHLVGAYSWLLITESPGPDQIFMGGGYFCPAKNRVLLAKWAKSSGSLTCSCIADSLSHTVCVETKKTVYFIAKISVITTENILWYLMRNLKPKLRSFCSHFLWLFLKLSIGQQYYWSSQWLSYHCIDLYAIIKLSNEKGGKWPTVPNLAGMLSKNVWGICNNEEK